MKAAVARVILVVLALAAGFLAGWRANVTLDPPQVHNIPVPVRDTLGWWVPSWP